MNFLAHRTDMIPTANPWIRCPKPNPDAQFRLFCFPYVGGGARIFQTWADRLPIAVEVCPIELPGHGTRLIEPPYSTLNALLDATLQALHPLLDRPFALFGHSMGALVSFELARSLRRNYHLEPNYLIVAGHRAPQIPDPELQIHTLSEPEFREKLRRLNGTHPTILNSAEMMELLMPTLRADFAICETYTYTPEPPLNCPILAMGGTQDAATKRGRLQAWREQTTSNFSKLVFPGEHFFIHSAEAQVLRSLNRVLTRLVAPQHLIK
jgi:medium-chain acyl-[acyl-carrier-protein] hydrolase